MKKKKINKIMTNKSPNHNSSNTSTLSKSIIRLYADNQGKPMGMSAVMRRLNTNKSSDIFKILEELESKGTLKKVTPGKYIYNGLKINSEKINIKQETFEGIVDLASGGFAYIL